MKTTKPTVQEQKMTENFDALRNELLTDINTLRQQAAGSITQIEKQHANSIVQLEAKIAVQSEKSIRMTCLSMAIEKSGGIHADPPKSSADLVGDAKEFEAYIIGQL